LVNGQRKVNYLILGFNKAQDDGMGANYVLHFMINEIIVQIICLRKMVRFF